MKLQTGVTNQYCLQIVQGNYYKAIKINKILLETQFCFRQGRLCDKPIELLLMTWGYCTGERGRWQPAYF